MKLPGNGTSIGPSDIIAVRECPRRASFGFERWDEGGEHPEAQSSATAYGSAFHEAAEFLAKNENATDDQAVAHAFAKWFDHLEPNDTERLRKDISTYRDRDMTGVRLVGAELELSVPLFIHEGREIRLRGRVDRLYQSLSDPGHYTMRDYKTNSQPRSQDEVDSDLQLWMYAALIRANYPDVVHLDQIYDQLQFGELTTSKSEEDCHLILGWAEAQVGAILAFNDLGPDGRPAPKLNRWCGHCAYAMDCPALGRATEFAQREVAAIAAEDLSSVGDLLPYVEQLEDMKAASKLLDNAIDRINGALKSISPEAREAMGYKLANRTYTKFGDEAKKAALDSMTEDQLLKAITISASGLRNSGAAKSVIDQISDLAEKRKGPGFIKRIKQ